MSDLFDAPETVEITEESEAQNHLWEAREKIDALFRQAQAILDEAVLKGENMMSYEDAARWFVAKLGHLKTEWFAFLFVDQGRRVVGHYIDSEGTTTKAVTYPRKVFGKAIGCGATGMFLAHNHPSLSQEPSSQDRQLTRKMQELGDSLEVAVVDHFIITGATWMSFKDRGYL